MLSSRRYDAVVSLRRPDGAAFETMPFASEELMLSVDERHPLAGAQSVRLSDAPRVKLAVYCGQGAFVDRTKAFLDTLKDRHDIRIFDDYFVFCQLLDGGDSATLTTKLVRLYRDDGENRKIIPLTDDGVRATYWLSYLAENGRKAKPLVDWARTVR